MTAVGFIACGVVKDSRLPAGNPARLISPVDYRGRACGFGIMEDLKYGYYLLDGTAVCVKSCPKKTDFTKFVCQYDLQSAVDGGSVMAYAYLAQKKCLYQLETSVVMNRCAPQQAIDFATQAAADGAQHNFTLVGGTKYTGSASSSSGWFNTFLRDVIELRGYVFGFGIGVATAVAFLYLYVLRIPYLLTVIIWSILFSIEAAMLIGSFCIWSLAESWANDDTHTDVEVRITRIFSFVGFAICFLYFCLMIVMRSRVQLAISIIQQACKALASMPILILTPVFQVIAISFFLVPWIIYVIYLASSGEMVDHVGTYVYAGQDVQYHYRTFEYTVNTKYAFLYMLFSFFWTHEFIIACGQLVIALSMSCWYFTKDKSNTGNSTVFWGLWCTFRYHLGTAAFGSLIIAIIQTIRAVIAYFQRQAKRSGNKVLQYVLCILQCCMWCLEKIMKFLNKNAYIQTAIYATSFCKSARKAFFLLLRNILRVAAVNTVAEFVLLLGKLFVPCVTTCLAYLCMAYATNNTEISGIVSPLIFIIILSYFVSAMFSEIFGMGIETILCCYVADEEMFAPGDRFADDGLKTSMQITAEAHAKQQSKVAPAPAEAVVSEPNDGKIVL